jgi:glycogen(starch) synthase
MNDSPDCHRSVSVVIITRNRPQMVRNCLEHLRRQTHMPDEIIVVDSSSAEDTQEVLAGYPDVVCLRIPDGRNNMPQARNLGVSHAQGEIIAFLDDDSMARDGWLRQLIAAYSAPDIGGVGGRVIDEYEDTRTSLWDQEIGKVQRNGVFTANFGLDPGHQVQVDHFRGCNMSFRKAILEELGGFDHNYTGGNTLEETDMCIRVKHEGYVLLFEPQAVVDHLSVRWRGYQEVRPGTLVYFHGFKNYAYFFFKNFGITWDTLRHIFIGRLYLQIAEFLRQPARWRLLNIPIWVAGALAGLWKASLAPDSL